jgi:hypothetical protein
MVNSCFAESQEEYNATLARCVSINNASAREACKQLAREQRGEARETCGEQKSARLEVCDVLREHRYEDPFENARISFINPDEIGPGGFANNPYVILQAGHTHMLRSEEYDEETDETAVELIVVHATDEVREIAGVDCRVLVDVVVEPEWEEDEGKWGFVPIEITDDWFAQDADSNVYYCGEVARNYEDGILRDLDGSFEAGLDYAEGGALTLAQPAVGTIHRQEYALGEAEDLVEYRALGADPTAEGIPEHHLDPAYRCSTPGNSCLMTYDFTPLEPANAEFKYYLAGVGFVLSAPLEDGEINRDSSEWLVCQGDSLAMLETCGIDDEFGPGALDELRQELCDLHDEYCDDGE